LNNKISGIKLVFSLYAAIKMMHGPINIRNPVNICILLHLVGFLLALHSRRYGATRPGFGGLICNYPKLG